MNVQALDRHCIHSKFLFLIVKYNTFFFISSWAHVSNAPVTQDPPHAQRTIFFLESGPNRNENRLCVLFSQMKIAHCNTTYFTDIKNSLLYFYQYSNLDFICPIPNIDQI